MFNREMGYARDNYSPQNSGSIPYIGPWWVVTGVGLDDWHIRPIEWPLSDWQNPFVHAVTQNSVRSLNSWTFRHRMVL